MDVLNIVDKLESLVGSSTKVPVASRALVDSKKVTELVDQLRLAVPQDIRAAQEILMKRDQIINQAQIEARRIKAAAEEQAKTKLNESDLVKAARRRADEILEDAQRKAQRMLEQADTESKTRRAEADAYALETLRNLESQLISLLTTVRRGLEMLE